MNPRRERGFQRWLVAVSLLAAGAAAAAEAPSLPALKVETVPEPEDTGQYHGVVELRLSSGHGAPLVLRERNPDDDESVPVPIPGRQFPIGREHVLLLGWSSVGSGTSNLHALLLHITPKAVVLEHNLNLRIVRWRAVLMVRRISPDEVLLGIPDWGIKKEVNLWETSLAVGKGWMESMREIRAQRVRFVAAEEQPTDTYYDPPFFMADRLAPARRATRRAAGAPLREIPELPERVAWLSVTSDGLAWKAGTR
ncbi:MAG TPA: hypothetical protein VN380_15060 [Thermoanaerobaculia bacterium]|jgi:hypothetical protein|nr:hypothetical protein [Thermoanaerobaculia bacterium]